MVGFFSLNTVKAVSIKTKEYESTYLTERSFDFPLILVEILVLPMVIAFGGISSRGIGAVAGFSWLGESTSAIPWADGSIRSTGTPLYLIKMTFPSSSVPCTGVRVRIMLNVTDRFKFRRCVIRGLR
jgi:hypothetical protein